MCESGRTDGYIPYRAGKDKGVQEEGDMKDALEELWAKGFAAPSEAKRAEELFSAMQRDLTAALAKLDEFDRLTQCYRLERLYLENGDLRRRLSEVEAERDALKEDAERYRWLKEMSRETMLERSELEIPCADGGSFVATFEQTHDLDAALDAARKK